MTVYVPEEFTSDEEDILRRYFTNLDGPVFALVNLPEVVKGALFARYSRSPKSLRRLFLDEFVGDLDIAGDAIPPGAICEPGSLLDVAPTILEALGCERPAFLDGHPLRAGIVPPIDLPMRMVCRKRGLTDAQAAALVDDALARIMQHNIDELDLLASAADRSPAASRKLPT